MADEKPGLKHEFPGSYHFKVMGKAEPGFREHIEALFVNALEKPLPEGSVVELPSKEGRFISLTLTVWLASEEQRQAIYLRLHQEKRIVYYL